MESQEIKMRDAHFDDDPCKRFKDNWEGCMATSPPPKKCNGWNDKRQKVGPCKTVTEYYHSFRTEICRKTRTMRPNTTPLIGFNVSASSTHATMWQLCFAILTPGWAKKMFLAQQSRPCRNIPKWTKAIRWVLELFMFFGSTSCP